MPSRRERLRYATAADHAALNRVIERSGLLASSAGYARFLEASWRARQCLDAGLEISAAGRHGWRRSSITSLLRLDYRDVAGSDLPPADDRKVSIQGGSAGFGTAYVLEGSALGAKALLRLVENLGYTAAFGARDLAQQVGSISGFRSFLAALEDATLTPAEEEACLRAARAAFSLFQAKYERISVAP
jgi:heme oxygenase